MARANEMCRLMINNLRSPNKVWISGNLHVDTKNNPNCVVYWGWHVAPTLCVRRYLFLDPVDGSGPLAVHHAVSVATGRRHRSHVHPHELLPRHVPDRPAQPVDPKGVAAVSALPVSTPISFSDPQAPRAAPARTSTTGGASWRG
ncbi:protein-glutamine glutaminase family protein [Streptomyces sp. NPDC020898]|uniref:protein-glutamine glutaminase family protein n=1 Tax=Streptomyces sp. NPDC020898 TaxID=3365101 RepID=UPI00379AAD80